MMMMMMITPERLKIEPIWILMKQEMIGWQWHQLDHMQITPDK